MSTTATDLPVAKVHTSLNLSDLKRSVEFYRVLFGLEPAKHRRNGAAAFQPPICPPWPRAGQAG